MAKHTVGIGQPKHQYICETCGTAKMQWPSQVSQRFFCSKACYSEGQRGQVPHNKGKAAIAQKPCAECGEIISGMPSLVRRRRYCSVECTAAYFRGELTELLKRYHVAEHSGCWEWQGPKRDGYGRMRLAGKYMAAHRASYEAHIGPIPDGLVIDHLCRNRGCINPEHLEPVTSAENIRRGEAGKGPRTEAQRRATSRSMKARWSNPAFRSVQLSTLKAQKDNPARLDAVRHANADPAKRMRQSEHMKQVWLARKGVKA